MILIKFGGCTNLYQIKCISTERIVKILGNENKELEEIIATAQNCIEIV